MITINLQKALGSFTVEEIVQKCLAEMLGTLILVLLGCMGVGISVLDSTIDNTHFIAGFNFGLAVMIAILVVAHISQCHINPAISLTLAIIKVIRPALAALYIVFQCLGAILGYGILYGLTPAFRKDNKVCVCKVHEGLNVWEGMAWEAIATAILCLVACGIFDERNAKKIDSIPIKFGLTVSALAVLEGPYTDCGINPARSLGPVLWTWQWKDHWVYWVGPLLGSGLAACFYRFLLYIPKEKELPTIETELQIQDIEDMKT